MPSPVGYEIHRDCLALPTPDVDRCQIATSQIGVTDGKLDDGGTR